MEILYKLKNLILDKTEKEIIDFVQSNVISFTDLYYFYLTYARFPNNNECNFIYQFGIRSMKDI